MGAGDEYANQLESWFHSLPGIVQSALHAPFTWMNDGLKAVAGQPQELVNAGAVYVQIGESVHQLGQQQLADRAALAGQWTGEAYQAFTAKMQRLEEHLDRLAEAIKKAKDLLEAGAEACVEGANMIIDIIKSLIMFVLADLAVSVALSFFTFGASLAAGISLWVAKAAEAVAKVASVLEKVAALLRKIAEVFLKLQKVFQTVAKVLNEIKEVLKESLAAKKAAKGWDKVGATVSHGITRTVVAKGIKVGTGGVVSIPGPLGSGYQAGKEYVDAYQDASNATEQVGQ
jgi:WXG100 family type VII secretion target